MIRALLTLVLLAWIGPATAAPEQLTGVALRDLCSGARGAAGSVTCSTYILGFTQGFALGQSTPGRACIPDGMRGEQLETIVRNFMRDFPDRLNEASEVIVAVAMMRAFPCAGRSMR